MLQNSAIRNEKEWKIGTKKLISIVTHLVRPNTGVITKYLDAVTVNNSLILNEISNEKKLPIMSILNIQV
jgi:hypothetical protein